MGVSRNILADASNPKDGRVPVAPQYLTEGVDGGQMSYISPFSTPAVSMQNSHSCHPGGTRLLPISWRAQCRQVYYQ